MIRKMFCCMLLCLGVLCLAPQSVSAQSGWVSDTLVLTFRQGPGNSFGVIKTLLSNTPVTILDEQNGFYKVKLSTKEVGWVDKKFIILEPTNAVKLEAALKENEKHLETISELQARISDLNSRLETSKNQFSESIDPLESTMKALQGENASLKTELSESRKRYEDLVDQSRGIQDIITKSNLLTEENKKLSDELSILKDSDQNSFRTAMIKWFLSGVGVLLIGWVIGRSVSSKKQRYGSLLD